MVAAGILLTRLLGFVRERVFAHYLGNGPAADAFRDFWTDADEIDLRAPEDSPAEHVASLDE